jgi:hypothetical protein
MGPRKYGSPRVMKWEGGMGVIPPGQFIGNAADKDSHAITTGWAEIDEKPRRLRSHEDCES